MPIRLEVLRLSGVWQGPGWWLASDGRWYPPHLYPSANVAGPNPIGLSTSDQPVGLSKQMRLGYALATLGCLALIMTSLLLSQSAVGPPSPRTAKPSKPSPADLVVGQSIKLPTALYLSGGSSALISPTQARVVASTMWNLWEQALIASDTRALSQLIAPGPLLKGTIYNCAFPAGSCVDEKTPRVFSSLVPVVPIERAYPLYFLAEFQTTEYVQSTSGLTELEPWTELQILTKSSSTQPWKLSFDTGYNGADGKPAPILPFDQTRELYNPAPSAVPPFPANTFLSLLATYWQSYKDIGRPPSADFFLNDGDTSGQGQQLALTPQNSIYAGSVEHYSFSADPGAGAWRFTVGSYPMECGSVLDTSSNTGIENELLFQNQDETNFGVPLPPGNYRKITTKTAHETCVFVSDGELDAVGDNTEAFAVTGEPR